MELSEWVNGTFGIPRHKDTCNTMTAVIGWSHSLYDSSYRVETVDMVSEPESMTAVVGWIQRIWCQSQSLYDGSYTVEPVDFLSGSQIL